jgi:hypothetical protein
VRERERGKEGEMWGEDQGYVRSREGRCSPRGGALGFPSVLGSAAAGERERKMEGRRDVGGGSGIREVKGRTLQP